MIHYKVSKNYNIVMEVFFIVQHYLYLCSYLYISYFNKDYHVLQLSISTICLGISLFYLKVYLDKNDTSIYL